MTYPPGQSITVRDGGLNLTSQAVAFPLVVGITSSGTNDTLYVYTDPNVLLDEQLSGPAVELALPVMQVAGGVMLLKTDGSVAAANTSVDANPIGTATGTITVAGTARNHYRFIGEIMATGTLGTGKFRYSLDGGFTYSPELTIPAGATYLMPETGLTLTFVPGAGAVFFEVGDSHTFTSTPAHYNTTDLSAAITALLEQIGTRKISQIYFAGKNASASAAATLAAAIATHLDTLAANDYYTRAIMDGGEEADVADFISDFVDVFVDERVMAVWGNADVPSLDNVVGYGTPRVPAMNVVSERAAGADLSENLGRKQSGPLRVTAITHDEGVSQAFTEDHKVTTLRTYRGQVGFYITNGYLKSAAGSDFVYWDWGRTIDALCDIIVARQDKWILSKLRALTDGTGNIDPRDAARIEAAVSTGIVDVLVNPENVEGFKGHVSGTPEYTVDRTNDFLSTRVFRSTARAVPLPPVEGIVTTIGLARSVA